MSKISQLTPLIEDEIDGTELAPVTKGGGTFSAPISYLGRRAALMAESARDIAIAAGIQYPSEVAAVADLADGAFGSYLDVFGNPVWAQRNGSSMQPLPGPWIDSNKIGFGIGGTVDEALLQRPTSDQLSAIGGQIVGIIRNARGAIQRNLEDFAAETLSIKDHGAIGDGTLHTLAEWIVPGALGRYADLADLQVDYPHATSTSQSIDEVAIQSALNEAKLLTSAMPCWVKVDVPYGAYLYASLHTDGERIDLGGDGVLLKTTAVGTGILFDGSTGRKFGARITNLNLGATVEGISGELVRFDRYSEVEVKVTIKNAFGEAAYRGIVFHRCYAVVLAENTNIEGCIEDNIFVNDCVDVFIDPGACDAAGRHNIHFNLVSGIYADSFACYGAGEDNWHFDAIGTPIEADINGFAFFHKCVGDTAGGHNWRLKQMGLTFLFDCWGATQSGAAADKHGFALDSCYEGGLFMCRGTNNNGGGIVDAGTFASERMMLMGNFCTNNGKQASSGVKDGIWLRNSGKFSLFNNFCYDSQPIKTQRYGLYCEATLNSLHMVGNDLTGNATGPYFFGAIPPIFSQTGNVTGESNVVESATSVVTSPFLKVFRVSGAVDILDITPKWEGREAIFIMASNARLVDQQFGGELALPSSSLTLGADGAAMFARSGGKWVMMTHSINDGA